MPLSGHFYSHWCLVLVESSEIKVLEAKYQLQFNLCQNLNINFSWQMYLPGYNYFVSEGGRKWRNLHTCAAILLLSVFVPYTPKVPATIALSVKVLHVIAQRDDFAPLIWSVLRPFSV